MTSGIGTPAYCAPEILNGEEYDSKVDVWSFGTLLLTMAVTGNLLKFIEGRWAASHENVPNIHAIFHTIWAGQWHPLSVNLPGVPPSIHSLMLRCCEFDPAVRPCFSEIYQELTGPCAAEVEGGSFIRIDPSILDVKIATYEQGVRQRAIPGSSIELIERDSSFDGDRQKEPPQQPRRTRGGSVYAISLRNSGFVKKLTSLPAEARARGGASMKGRMEPGSNTNVATSTIWTDGMTPPTSASAEEHERRRSDHLIRSSTTFRPNINPLTSSPRTQTSARKKEELTDV